MKTPKWQLEAHGDLSGCWLAWESPIGRMIIQASKGQTFDAFFCPTDSDSDIDEMVGNFETIIEGEAGALAYVKKQARRKIKAAAKLCRELL